MTSKMLATVAVATTLLAAGTEAADVKTGYVAANGLNYYYEIAGEGEPLLLPHGGRSSERPDRRLRLRPGP